MPEKVFIRGIPDEMWRALKARASLEGITVSQAVQAAIRAYLSGTSRAADSGPTGVWGGITDVGGSGDKDVSERHDHYLAEANLPDGEE